MSTAGIVVIGNEVLSGKVEEANARYLIGRLRALGVSLRRVVIVRDEVGAIAEEVRAMSAVLTNVFTSGGVGATHDDVTMRGIAEAFGVGLELHADLVAKMRARYPEPRPAMERQALLPEGAELLETGIDAFPLVKVRNVYVFPGVPSFLRAKWEAVEHRFLEAPIILAELYLNVGEGKIAELLYELDALHPSVEIGSYPRFDGADHRTKVTLESQDLEAVRAAFFALRERLDPAWIVRARPATPTGLDEAQLRPR